MLRLLCIHTIHSLSRTASVSDPFITSSAFIAHTQHQAYTALCNHFSHTQLHRPPHKHHTAHLTVQGVQNNYKTKQYHTGIKKHYWIKRTIERKHKQMEDHTREQLVRHQGATLVHSPGRAMTRRSDTTTPHHSPSYQLADQRCHNMSQRHERRPGSYAYSFFIRSQRRRNMNTASVILGNSFPSSVLKPNWAPIPWHSVIITRRSCA